jgi:hypothetical protein
MMLAAANQKTFAHTGAMKKMPLIFSEDMRAGKKLNIVQTVDASLDMLNATGNRPQHSF